MGKSLRCSDLEGDSVVLIALLMAAAAEPCYWLGTSGTAAVHLRRLKIKPSFGFRILAGCHHSRIC